MKCIRFHIPIMSLLALLLNSCSKDTYKDEVQTSIKAPVLQMPAQNSIFKLDRLSNPTVALEWDRAATADHTGIFYTVLIDKEGGNFKTPVLTRITDSAGLSARLAFTHQQLNQLADKAGIKPGQQGKLQWCVEASNGVVSARSANAWSFTVTRDAGTVAYPSALFLNGTATEADTDLGKAVRFKKLTDGVFECYTSLGPGTFSFLNANTGTPDAYVLNGTNITDGTSTTSPATTKKTYRIYLDFNTATGTLTEIRSVGLWFALHNKVTIPLQYHREGIWRAMSIPLLFANAPWGKDERYKFSMILADSQGQDSVSFLGSAQKNNDGRPGAGTPASYYYLLPVDASQWDYTYKLSKESNNADILLKCTADAPYTHEIIYR